MEKKTIPPLWKKAKTATTTVSAFISDLSSRRRRSPLLVQTGFPTSLADIVVKNRSRLKKPSSGRKIPVGDCPSSSPPSSQISGCSEAPAVLDERSGSETGGGGSHDSEICNSDFEDLSRPGFDDSDNAGIPGCGWFSAILKVLVVVVLALVTKEIAVGITACALVLFLLEFVLKRWALRKCEGGSDSVPSNDSDLGPSGCNRRMENLQDDGGFVEVEKIINEEDCLRNETEVSESNLDLLMCEWGLDSIKIKKDGNRKLGKSISVDKFLKKLVPKKFRAPKAEKVCKEGESDSGSEDSELKQGEEEEDVQVQDEFHAKEDEGVSSPEFYNETSSLINSDDMVLTENICTETTKSNMGNLIIFVIVLLGLVQGRAVALLLTVGWFLLGNSVETGWRNWKKMYGSGGVL